MTIFFKFISNNSLFKMQYTEITSMSKGVVSTARYKNIVGAVYRKLHTPNFVGFFPNLHWVQLSSPLLLQNEIHSCVIYSYFFVFISSELKHPLLKLTKAWKGFHPKIVLKEKKHKRCICAFKVNFTYNNIHHLWQYRIFLSLKFRQLKRSMFQF